MSRAFEDLTIHFLGPMTISGVESGAFGYGQVLQYGQEMRITEAIRALNTDEAGNCPFDLVDDEPAQVARWGRVVFRRGPWPPDQPRYEQGSIAWQDALEEARREAWKIKDPGARSARFAAIKEEFGSLPTTSRTILSYGETAGA